MSSGKKEDEEGHEEKSFYSGVKLLFPTCRHCRILSSCVIFFVSGKDVSWIVRMHEHRPFTS